MHSRWIRCSSLAVALALAVSVHPARADLKLPRVSPRASVSQALGLVDLSVVYCRPGVKGRAIWGALVPYDAPWRTGANEATTFTTSDSIRFGGKPLAAGTYALLTIPGKDQWTVVLNADKDLWGSVGYKPEKDVLRVEVVPTAADSEEWMQFTFEELTNNSATLVLRWEKLRVAVPITADVEARALADSRAAVTGLKADAWRTPYQAANYCFGANVALEQGRAWLEQSLAAERNFSNLSLLARWQMRDGKKSEALATAKQAVAAGKASKDRVDTAATEKLIADWSAAK